MSYESTREILDRIKDVHKRVSSFYRELSEKTKDERSKMLLEYLSQHQQIYEETLKNYANEGQEDVLNTWVQYTPEKKGPDWPNSLDYGSDLTVDDIIGIILEFENYIKETYEDMALHARIEPVREVFEKLQAQEETERAKLMEQVQMFKDV